MALLILALLQRIFLMSSLMLLLVWLIFFMVLIKLLPILGTISGKTVIEGRKANDSHADCYQYFCVPEYGTANGRLHFHAVHFMRTLPTGSVDPNFGRRVRNRRQLNSLQNTWPYGYSMPIAVRYTQD